MQYRIEEFKPEYKDDLFKLYTEVFGKEEGEKNIKRWNWQFLANPHANKKGPLCWIFKYKGEIVGSIAGMPAKLKLKNSLKDAYWSCNLMVHPRYQNKAIGAFLIRHFSQSVGDHLMTGLREDSYALIKKMGYFEVDNLFYMYKMINSKRFLGKKISGKFLKTGAVVLFKAHALIFNEHKFKGSDVEIFQVFDFDDEFDELWDRVSKKIDFLIKRDKDYLRWKYAQHPYYKYTILVAKRKGELVGYIILRVCNVEGIKYGFIPEIFLDPDDDLAIDALIYECIKIFKKEKVDVAKVLTTNSRIKGRMRNVGFFTKKETPRFLFALDRKYEGSNNSSNWFFTKGDSDLDLI